MTRILGLSGSLRRESTNTVLLRTLGQALPAGFDFTVHDYADVPLYNADLETPESVDRLKRAIDEADGLLIATPEYNHSVPGVLKNALDWASRPAFRSVLRDKPTGVVSAAASFVGGARGQQHLKTILLGMGTPVFPWPELLVGQARNKIEDGRITDEVTLKFLGEFARGYADWISRG